MAVLEKMPNHPRLYRRGTTYYHRAAVPKDIADSYPKSEETFSLRTRDPREALQRIHPRRRDRPLRPRWATTITYVGLGLREFAHRGDGTYRNLAECLK